MRKRMSGKYHKDCKKECIKKSKQDTILHAKSSQIPLIKKYHD